MSVRSVLLALSMLVGCGPNIAEIDDTSATGSTSSGTTTTGVTGPSSSSGMTSTTVDVADSSSGGTSSSSDSTSGSTGSSTGTGSTDSTGSSTSAESSGTTGLGDCPGQPGEGATIGMPCTGNEDCISGVCLLFQDVPADDDAVCGAPTPDCSTRFTGLARDIVSGSAVSTEIGVIPALDAITNPAGAVPLASGTSLANGLYDFATDGPITAAIAVVGRVGGDGTHALSGSGLMADEAGYAPGPAIHELWLVTEDALDGWSAAMDDAPADTLPLGEAGGIVGVVRDVEGNPVAGATVAPVAAFSQAFVRYPQADGTVVASQTDATGLFVIVDGGPTGEDYVATAGGLTGIGAAFDAPQIVFMMPITVE